MFDHVSIGVADIAQSKKFYDAALKPLGYSRLSDGETSLGLRRQGGPAMARRPPRSRSSPTKPNRACISSPFVAPDRAAVDAFHGRCAQGRRQGNGKARLRADYGPK